MRRTLVRYGPRGKQARVFTEGHLVRVQWRRQGSLRTVSWPNTRENRQVAKAYAEGLADELDKGQVRVVLSVRDLWTRYTATDAYTELRDRSQVLNAEAWRAWELFVQPETRAEDLGPETMARFRASLESAGYALSTVKRRIAGVKTVYSWAEEHELIVNRIHRYRLRVAKNKRTPVVAEYRHDDFLALCEALPLDSSRTWRAGVVLRLCGFQGRRQKAVRHLTPADISEGTITFQAEWDKQGKTVSMPLRRGSRLAVEAALRWRETTGYDGPWLIPAQRVKKPYSAQSFWWSLTEAEKRAGIPHIRGRGAHGLRRMLAGDVLAETGNAKLAMQAIGDTDLRVMERYLVDRDDALEQVFRDMDGPETVTATVIEGAP
jgi:integrase